MILLMNLVIVVVVVVVMSLSCGTYMGQLPRTDEEFHQTVAVLEHICDVSGITQVTLAFCCPF